jgi:hypothetical protein
MGVLEQMRTLALFAVLERDGDGDDAPVWLAADRAGNEDRHSAEDRRGVGLGRSSVTA